MFCFTFAVVPATFPSGCPFPWGVLRDFQKHLPQFQALRYFCVPSLYHIPFPELIPCMCPGPQDWGRMKEWGTMGIFHWCYFLVCFWMNPFLWTCPAWLMVSAYTYPSQRNDFSVGVRLIWIFCCCCYTRTPTDKIEVPFSSFLKANCCHEFGFIFYINVFWFRNDRLCLCSFNHCL